MNLWNPQGTKFEILSEYGKFQFVQRWNKGDSMGDIGAFFGRDGSWATRMGHQGRLAGYNLPQRQQRHGFRPRPKAGADITITHANGCVSTVGSGDAWRAEAFAKAFQEDVR